jgi:uncharacterized protein YdeI (YjbR/CyaY-like superfamily)
MKNPEFDDYINKSNEFAKPVLHKLRELVQEACPVVSEEIKWGFPNFIYKDQILCSMASFKSHCSFGFWLGDMLDDHFGIINPVGKTAMGSLGKIYTSADIPEDQILISYIRKAMSLTDKGIKKPSKSKTTEMKEQTLPEDFLSKLELNELAKANFDKFSYSCKKEYLEWICGAKTSATREKRIIQAVEMIEAGKDRNWKYK